MRNVFNAGIIIFASLLTGCATIVTGLDQSFTVVTEKNVEEAKCALTDSKGAQWFVSSTPGTVTVRKGHGPMTIICKKEGYKTATVEVAEAFAGATLGNIILGGAIGIVVDAASGASQKYPDKVIIWLEPDNWESDSDQAQWLKEKKDYEEAIVAKQKESPTFVEEE